MDKLTIEEAELFVKQNQTTFGADKAVAIARQLADVMRELQYYKELAHNLSTGSAQPSMPNQQAPYKESEESKEWKREVAAASPKQSGDKIPTITIHHVDGCGLRGCACPRSTS